MAQIAGLEKRILIEQYGRWLWQMRRQPHHAALWLTGIFLPPHERYWLHHVYFAEYKQNDIVAGRGTSKSFTGGSLAQPLKCVLFKNVASLLLSASGFRGGKELLRDSERMLLGQLRSQEIPGNFLRASISSTKPIQKDPSKWDLVLRSHSRHSTVPTNNPDQLRGLRATEVLIDERNTFPGEIVHKIVRPMLNVGQDFRRAASGGDNNKVFQISTIDFTVRDWYPELQVAKDLQQREYEAWKSRKAGDWQEYDRLQNERDGQLRTASFSFTRFDYTDLLIPEYIRTLDGETTYRVEYPREKGIRREDILKYDEQDRVAYWYTYPVDKAGIESPKRNGTVDPEIWNAEQRNIFISSSGNVFSFDLIQKISERPIPVGPVKRRKKADEEDDDEGNEFYAPVMVRCADPCVLGVDVARETDESSFVVIRLGQLAEVPFDAHMAKLDKKGRPYLGKTDWNHICWAESHRKMEAGDVALKVRDLFERYNIVSVVPTAMLPNGIGGIGMDKRGGGGAVRDELGNPKPRVVDGQVEPNFDWAKVTKLYDPEDKEGFAHYSALNDPNQYWGGLRLLATTNEDNREWTYGSRALMEARKLYIAYWMSPSKWAFEKGMLTANGEPDRSHEDYVLWETGYNGIRRLKLQLLRLQREVTAGAAVERFVAPTKDRSKDEGKKDLWAGMIYAVGIARQHLNAETQQAAEVPMVAPLLVTFQPTFFGM